MASGCCGFIMVCICAHMSHRNCTLSKRANASRKLFTAATTHFVYRTLRSMANVLPTLWPKTQWNEENNNARIEDANEPMCLGSGEVSAMIQCDKAVVFCLLWPTAYLRFHLKPTQKPMLVACASFIPQTSDRSTFNVAHLLGQLVTQPFAAYSDINTCTHIVDVLKCKFASETKNVDRYIFSKLQIDGCLEHTDRDIHGSCVHPDQRGTSIDRHFLCATYFYCIIVLAMHGSVIAV